MGRFPLFAMPLPTTGSPLPLLFTASLLAWLCIAAIDVTRPKAEPRPSVPYELNEFKVTRHEHT
ncbi:hypothetical protein SR882_05175 [Guyparkeria halophila]|uniref:Uncharacterized protein n=1 Tax=Guyparkeria halophila TaxID=47960 RepID=A0ABZ0YZY9_9GAMM|nr:hypothetical protein [Guyparkeria halophila]WQH17298.1 hypothetical protein SR882_05175 [Guyparkeria halophila]